MVSQAVNNVDEFDELTDDDITVPLKRPMKNVVMNPNSKSSIEINSKFRNEMDTLWSEDDENKSHPTSSNSARQSSKKVNDKKSTMSNNLKKKLSRTSSKSTFKSHENDDTVNKKSIDPNNKLPRTSTDSKESVEASTFGNLNSKVSKKSIASADSVVPMIQEAVSTVDEKSTFDDPKDKLSSVSIDLENELPQASTDSVAPMIQEAVSTVDEKSTFDNLKDKLSSESIDAKNELPQASTDSIASMIQEGFTTVDKKSVLGDLKDKFSKKSTDLKNELSRASTDSIASMIQKGVATVDPPTAAQKREQRRATETGKFENVRDMLRQKRAERLGLAK